MTGHGRLADDLRARPRRQPVLRRHVLPRPAAARAAVVHARCCQALGEAWRDARATRWTARRQRSPPTCGRARRSPAAAPLRPTRCSTPRSHDAGAGVRRRARRVRRRAEVPAVDGAGAPAAPRGPGTAARDGRAGDRGRRTCEAMARGGIYDQLGGGFARYSVDARLGGAALREDALRQRPAARRLRALVAGAGDPLAARVARRPPTSCSASCARPRAASPPRWTPTAEGVEGAFYAWTPGAAGRGARRGRRPPGRRGLLEVTERGTFEHGASTLQLLADPDDPQRWADVRARLLAARAERTPPGPRRQGGRRPGTAWRSPRSPRRAAARRAGLGRRRRGGRRAAGATCTCPTARPCGGSPATAAPGSTPACSRTTPAWPTGFLALLQATGDPVWLTRAGIAARRRAGALRRRRRRLPRHRRRRRGAGRSAPRPHRQRQPVRLLGDGARLADVRRAHRLGPAPRRPPRRRCATVAAGRPGAALRRLVAGRGRGGGDGPLEVAVVGPRRRPTATRSRRRARRTTSPGAVVVAGEPGLDVPLLAGRDLLDGAAAAYVCRGFVCERPVATPDELVATLRQ